MLDAIDKKVVRHLMAYGRATWAELATLLGLSAPATADRVRRLEERGVIKGYAALVDPATLGLTLTAFVGVTLEHPEHRAEFLELVHALPQIQACHHVAGDYDYLLQLRCKNTADLEHFLTDSLKSKPGVIRSRTTIVLSTVKETPVMPMEQV